MRIASSTLLAIAILPFIHRMAFADCAACTVSKGITIRLKSGKQESGYTTWNDFMPEQLPDEFGFRADPRAKALLAKGTDESEDKFGLWLDLVNFVATHGLRPQPNWPTNGIPLYRRLVRISTPFERYVGVKGDRVEIPIDSIVEISRNYDFPLNVDTTGIDVLPEEDIELLSKEPRFTVQVEGSVGGTSYIVYGKKVTLTQVLEHAALAGQHDFRDVLVNGVRIRGGLSGAGPSVPVETSSLPGPLKAECSAFLDRLGEIDRSRCESEHRGNQGLLKMLPPNSAARPSLIDRQRQLEATCLSQPPGKRPEWKSLGTPENLRRLQIVVSSYGWD